MRQITVLLGSLLAIGCGGPSAQSTPPTPGPLSSSEPVVEETPPLSPALEEGPMTPERARRVVAEVEASWPLAEGQPLLNPTTLADAEKILSLDQVRLFPAAVAFLETQDGVDA